MVLLLSWLFKTAINCPKLVYFFWILLDVFSLQPRLSVQDFISQLQRKMHATQHTHTHTQMHWDKVNFTLLPRVGLPETVYGGPGSPRKQAGANQVDMYIVIHYPRVGIKLVRHDAWGMLGGNPPPPQDAVLYHLALWYLERMAKPIHCHLFRDLL